MNALNSFLPADFPFYVDEAKGAALGSHPPATSAGRVGHPATLGCFSVRVLLSEKRRTDRET
jgi:hypothetical protein